MEHYQFVDGRICGERGDCHLVKVCHAVDFRLVRERRIWRARGAGNVSDDLVGQGRTQAADEGVRDDRTTPSGHEPVRLNVEKRPGFGALFHTVIWNRLLPCRWPPLT
jgi:hypothetical protein